MAVADAELRSRGSSSLHVVDTSVMPLSPNGHLRMAVFAITKRAQGLIQQSTT